MEQRCKVCHCDFVSLMPSPLCLSCDSLASMFTHEEMFIKIAALESQLAAQAAAVEASQKILDQEGYEIELGGGYAALTKDYSASTVAEGRGQTWWEALAALVAAAQSKENDS